MGLTIASKEAVTYMRRITHTLDCVLASSSAVITVIKRFCSEILQRCRVIITAITDCYCGVKDGEHLNKRKAGTNTREPQS